MTEDRKKRSATSRHWECAFPQPAAEMVDKQVDEMWKTTFKKRTPFGDLRNQFRRLHCRTINPYGSDDCPYDRDVCALAFMDAVRVTAAATPKVPVGYFRKVAKTMGAIRADGKPLARERRGRMIVLSESETADFSESHADQGGSTPAGLEETEGPMPRVDLGPVSIGELFRQIGVQPRQGEGAPDDGEEGT